MPERELLKRDQELTGGFAGLEPRVSNTPETSQHFGSHPAASSDLGFASM